MLGNSVLQNPCVRDLAWVISNPPIIQSTHGKQSWSSTDDWTGYSHAFQQQLIKLDNDPSELIELLESQHDHRLGHRFETLLTYWFKHNGRHQILAQNLQVNDGQRTLGEFDFIVKDLLTGKVQHWEVACKFYLGINNTKTTENWVGPMLKDRLSIKYDAMQNRQSLLSEQPPAHQVLKEKGINIDQRICLMKGRLFHPFQQKTIYPSLIASHHQQATWLRPNQFLDTYKETTFRWLALNKNQWMASQVYSSQLNYLNTQDMLDFFLSRENTRPLCIAGFSDKKSTVIETERLFLVAKDWAI